MIGLQTLRSGLRAIEPRAVRVRASRCPFCGPSLIVRLRDEETGIRCLRCGASAVHLSLGWAMHSQQAVDVFGDVYELSSRGPLVEWLRRRSATLTLSEYFDDVAPGIALRGLRCEDVQALSFPDASFDLITHTEVLEHVPDDAAGLRELFRVLRPGGAMFFTVPLHAAPATVERAVRRDGRLVHLLPPTYHGDRLRGPAAVLCFRDYGPDLLDRVRCAGFHPVALLPRDARVPWSHGRQVVTARKPMS